MNLASTKIIPIILAFSAFELAFPQSSDDEDVIVVSAGKIEQSASDAVEKVQVITSEEIQTSGAKTLTEAVKSLPGVTVKNASAGNPTDSISMQGFDSDYVKVLVDGIAVSGDIGGSTAVFEIPVEDIDHIEVVQGASSALYGSDAMGGVINIITKKTKPEYDGVKLHGSLNEEFSYSIEKDWRNYTAGSISASGENLSAGLTGSFDYAPGVKDETYYALAGGDIEYYKTPKKRLSFLRGTADWRDDWGRLGAYGLFANADQVSNYTAAYSANATMEYDTKRFEGGLSGEYNYDSNITFSGFSSGKVYLLDTTYERGETIVTTDDEPTEKDSDFIDWESELRSSIKAGDFNTVLVGLNGNLQTINGDNFDSREKQLLLSLFAQDTLNLFDEKVQVVPGFRFDFAPKVNDADATFMATPKLSLKYNPTETTAIRFSYGMGYKTPTLKQKYWEFTHNYASGSGNFILYGNPDLDPEKSQSFNLAVEQNVLNLFKINASGYFNYIIDMIDSVVTDASSDPQIRTYKNIDKAMTFGGDVSLETKLDRFSGKVGYAYTGAKQKENGEWVDMALRVTHRISGSVGYLIPLAETKLTVNAEWNSRQLVEAGGDEYTPDYFMLGANLSKMFWNDKLELYARADNILNNRHFYKGTISTGRNSQRQYYGLYAGTTFSLGGRLKF